MQRKQIWKLKVQRTCISVVLLKPVVLWQPRCRRPWKDAAGSTTYLNTAKPLLKTIFIIENLSNNEGDGYESVTFHVNSRYFTLYRVYSNLFNSSNVRANFSEVELSKFRKRKRKSLSFVHVPDKTRTKALSRCSRAATAKKCTKKGTCKVVVL